MLTLETIYQSDCFKIELDKNNALVKTQWLRPVSDQELRENAITLREILIKLKVERILANATELGALPVESKDWLATLYYETLSLTPTKKLARILPSNLFHHVALEAVITRAKALSELNYLTKNFQEEDHAIEWLMT